MHGQSKARAARFRGKAKKQLPRIVKKANGCESPPVVDEYQYQTMHHFTIAVLLLILYLANRQEPDNSPALVQITYANFSQNRISIAAASTRVA